MNAGEPPGSRPARPGARAGGRRKDMADHALNRGMAWGRAQRPRDARRRWAGDGARTKEFPLTTINLRRIGIGKAGPIAAAFAAAVCAVCLVYVAAVAGPAHRTAIDGSNAAEIADEDATTCVRFGSPPPGEAFMACSRTPDQVRSGQSRRNQADMADF